jgi:hypothetical protein
MNHIGQIMRERKAEAIEKNIIVFAKPSAPNCLLFA